MGLPTGSPTMTTMRSDLRIIPIANGPDATIDEEDWTWAKDHSFWVNVRGYVMYSVWLREEKRIWSRSLHAHVMGAPPPGLITDHINGDRADNRRANLRFTNQHVNGINRHKLNRNNRSGVRGVSWQPPGGRRVTGRWQAKITSDGVTKWLGSFTTMEQAVEVRKAAELEFYGELCPVPV